MSRVTDPNILAQLNGEEPQKVTDPSILRQLNGEKEPDKTSSLGSFGRSAFSSVPHAIYNMMKAAGIPVVDEYPSGPLDVKPEDTEEHPIASFAGEMAGNPLTYIGAGAGLKGAIKGAQALPGGLSKLADFAPLTKGIAKRPYKELEKYLAEHGIGEGVKINPSTLKEARKILKSQGVDLPEEAIKRAFQKASQGSHESIHNIQSSVRSSGRQLMKKGGIEHDLGKDMHALAEKITGEAKAHYEDIGHIKAAELMKKANDRYARYHKILPAKRILTGAAAASAFPKWIRELVGLI